MATLAEVRADEGERHEVALHGRLLTALEKHLLKHTWVVAVKQTDSNQLGRSSVEEKRSDAKEKRINRPEYGHLRCFLQEFFHAVHHPGVKLNHVHHLCQVGVFLYWKRGLVHTCVGLKEEMNKSERWHSPCFTVQCVATNLPAFSTSPTAGL